MKNIFKNYYAPTPKKWRKLGDTFLVMAAYGEMHEQAIDPVVGRILVYVGLAGKVLTNFFAEDESK